MIKKILILLFFINLVIAKNMNYKFISEFKGGLDTNNISRCESSYSKQCKPSKAKYALDAITKEWDCVEKKLQKDLTCTDAYMIRKLTGYPYEQVRQYKHNISVFYTTSLADAIDSFYMVDSCGKFIELSDDESLLLKNVVYKKLKDKYKDLTLMTILYFDKPFENQFPSFQDDDIIQLIFKQDIKEHGCVGCKNIAIAFIAYEFSNSGEFIGTKLLKIRELN